MKRKMTIGPMVPGHVPNEAGQWAATDFWHEESDQSCRNPVVCRRTVRKHWNVPARAGRIWVTVDTRTATLRRHPNDVVEFRYIGDSLGEFARARMDGMDWQPIPTRARKMLGQLQNPKLAAVFIDYEV